jgi:hypothetical protein
LARAGSEAVRIRAQVSTALLPRAGASEEITAGTE